MLNAGSEVGYIQLEVGSDIPIAILWAGIVILVVTIIRYHDKRKVKDAK